ncbi:MAG: C25 family cysteine peptidase, partial [Candidatus Cloacimonetes bacterium]|nr:C25 family cysteine peptidase [Candidatus Cloacimonadota bacterium]
MRKYILLAMLGMICFLTATVANENNIIQNNSFKIESKTPSSMQITFTLPEFSTKKETIGTTVYNRISLPDANLLTASGMPELPFMTTNIAIPHNGNVSVEVLSSSLRVLSGFKPYPAQDDSETEAPKGVIVNNEYYRSGGNYPEAEIQYSDPMIVRDFRVVTIQVNPFIFNAQTGELSIRENISFRLNFDNAIGLNELAAEPLNVSSSFSNIYQSTILNYGDYRGQMIANTPPRILIIYGYSSDTGYLDAVNAFAFWKRQKGAEVLMASTAAGEAGTSTTSIKAYIQAKYDNPATRPDYVILIGDTGGSFAIPAYSVSSGGGDYPYTHLSGTDLLGDCFIGRISAENLSELKTIFAKIYLYEKDINLNTASWLNRMLLVGDWAPSGISTVYISKYIKEISSITNPNYTYTELYSDAPTPAAMNAALNQGVGVFDFRGYIGMSGWSPDTALNNGSKLPHAVIITCSTGNYSGGTATTESFIRLGTQAVPQGAVTAIGMSTSSTHTTFNNVLTGGIFEGLYIWNMRTMGEALLNGKLYMDQIFGVSSPNDVKDFTHWCNLMGDPTMEVFVGIPSTYQITAPTSIPVGYSLLDVVVRNANNTPLSGQCVTLSVGSVILARAYSDEYGLATLSLPSPLTVSTGVITVSGHNFKPLQQDISLVAGGLVPGQITINDDNIGASIGNNDGLANGGERIELSFALQNTTTASMRTVSGT